MNKSALFILANGFEELEAIAPIDLLRRAGIKVTISTIENSLLVTGKNNMTFQAEVFLDSVSNNNYDLVVLPGGPGHKRLRSSEKVLTLIKNHSSKNIPIGAICAAPTVLQEAGLLNGNKYTAHHTVANELTKIISDQAVVEDGNIITSQGAGTAVEFGLALVKRLCGQDSANQVAKSICFFNF